MRSFVDVLGANNVFLGGAHRTHTCAQEVGAAEQAPRSRWDPVLGPFATRIRHFGVLSSRYALDRGLVQYTKL